MKNNLNLEKEKLNLHEKINSLSLLTENDLLVFKQLFDKIHPSFYDSLLTKCDDLTKSEARLAMLIRLNLTSIEMSRILGISQDSVRKSNLRLRKKLSIDSQKELVQFIKAV
jgi:DNA-binding CsgD family transcriptional regulator